MQPLAVVSERQVYDNLDAAIRDAHDAGRLQTLAINYARGGALYARQGESDAACFFWTQAYVFALDCGDEALVEAMRAKLAAHGRMG